MMFLMPLEVPSSRERFLADDAGVHGCCGTMVPQSRLQVTLCCPSCGYGQNGAHGDLVEVAFAGHSSMAVEYLTNG